MIIVAPVFFLVVLDHFLLFQFLNLTCYKFYIVVNYEFTYTMYKFFF